MEQNRLKSPVVWSAIAAQLLALLMLMGVIGEGMADAIRAVVMGSLEVLVVFGVLNNPTDKLGF